MSDVPKEWRAPWSLLATLALVVAGTVAVLGFVDARAQTVAREVIQTEFAEQVKREAVEAARQAVREASAELKVVVREAVQQIAIDQARHNAADDQRQQDVERRLERVERAQK